VAEQEQVEALKAREEADANVELSEKISVARNVEDAIGGLSNAERPIDIMARQYKSLQYAPDTTPAGIARAEEQERRIGQSEKHMKSVEKQKSSMLQDDSIGKMPTLAGLRAAVKTTIDANMKEAVGDLPWSGGPSWDDILPTVNQFKGKEQPQVAAPTASVVL